MDILQQFLDSSTIHGVSYISSSKSLVARCLWSLTVIGGFVTAGLVIQSSFSDWSRSPVATSITTHAIKQVSFPEVKKTLF